MTDVEGRAREALAEHLLEAGHAFLPIGDDVAVVGPLAAAEEVERRGLVARALLGCLEALVDADDVTDTEALLPAVAVLRGVLGMSQS